MSVEHKTLIKFSSKQRNNLSDTSSNFKVNIGNGSVSQNVLSCFVDSISFANTQYNINKYNNTLHYDTGIIIKTLTIPEGQYDINTLMLAVESAFLAESPSIVLDLALDQLTKKIKIVSCAPATGFFDYFNGYDSPLSRVLGVAGRLVLVSNNLILPEVPKLSGLTQLFIESKVISSSPSIEVTSKLLDNSSSLTPNSELGNIIEAIGCSSPFGFLIHWENQNMHNIHEYQSPQNFTSIDIKLLDNEGREVLLNGSDIEFVLNVTYI